MIARIPLLAALTLLLEPAPLSPDAPNPGPFPPPEPTSAAPTACHGSCATLTGAPTALDAFEIARWLSTYATEPPGDAGVALETLLYHGGELDDVDLSGLPPAHERLLARELSRRHVTIDVRLRTEDGDERLHLGRTRVPLDEKQHLHSPAADTNAAPEISLTARRVGLGHIWIRC